MKNKKVSLAPDIAGKMIVLALSQTVLFPVENY